MDIYNVKRFAEVLAIQAEIEGMKTANMERESHGYTVAYGEDAFAQAAKDLRAIAAKRNDQI